MHELNAKNVYEMNTFAELFLLNIISHTYKHYLFFSNERAMAGPTLRGEIKSFCREKGHGFVIPESGGDPLFTHISE